MDDKIEAWANDIIREVAELPDRNSPEGRPEMMLVSADELRNIIIETAPEGHRLVPVEPDDEQLRRALAVVNPSIYGHSLRDPRNGPNLAANVEKDIATMRKQYSAMLAASQESGT